MASVRPSTTRTASTNIRAAGSQRPLESKLAVVTGASRGIGRAICENLATKGASIILGYTSAKSAETTESLAKELQQAHGIQTLVVQADMADPKGPEHLINTAKNHFSHPKSGKFQIDIVINNAGVSVNNALEEITIDDFNSQYRVNVLGPLLLMQATMPYLPHDRSGRVVNVSSVSATLGFKGQTVYGGTKAALNAMTRTWSKELSERCTVNAINPGPVLTEMWAGTTAPFKKGVSSYVINSSLMAVREGIDSPELVEDAKIAGGRPAYTEEIAGVVGMLCSADSSWVTGQVVSANGGMVLSE